MLKTWGKRLGRWLEKWGYALMCILCAAVVLLSALWTRDAQREERLSTNALSGMDETLKDREKGNEVITVMRPVQGDITRPFTLETVCFEETSVFSAHPAVDFRADGESSILSVTDGTVALARDGEVHILHEDETWIYRGLGAVSCTEGKHVKAGDTIGMGGGYVPFEGEGHVCVSLWENGEWVDFAPRLP